ncbi:MAG: ATP-binding cassette domain-containing protein, partial [Gammaproteobacteria bacterium]|nr:ATP-binding cassette domain-containing protein [Gammaproteobacteria bacterium]
QCILEDVQVRRNTPQGQSFVLQVPHLEISTEQGNKIPVLGVSGAGKSTFLDVIATMTIPARGRIIWCFPESGSRKAREYSWGSEEWWKKRGDLRELRRMRFGFSFQDSTLIPHLTIRENLVYPQSLSGKSTREANGNARAMLEKVCGSEIMESGGVENFFNRFPHQLSGGQRQRIALIQSMMNDPQVLFADEPTGSLDRLTRQRVMEVLYQWADERSDRLLLWVTHHESDPLEADAKRALLIRGRMPVATASFCAITKELFLTQEQTES